MKPPADNDHQRDREEYESSRDPRIDGHQVRNRIVRTSRFADSSVATSFHDALEASFTAEH